MGKMLNNKNFYIFKTTSSFDSSEIISKLEQYETTDEFFKFYTNKDIKAIFKLYEEIDSIYSSLYRKSMPTLETLIPICNSLDITLAKFFLIEDEITDELFCVVNELSDSTRKLLLEVAKNMKT